MPIKKGGEADPETYLHRVGRTGRFGRPGCALNLISDNKELAILKKIEVYFSRQDLIKEIPQDTDPEEFEALLKA
jgi:ATP-dependent RNA helicase DDX19/DBP5